MASSLLKILDSMREQTLHLRKEMESLKARNRQLEEDNSELKKEAEEAIRKRDEALQDVEYLRVSHRLADDNSLIETRRHVAQLIRNIDRCITMLKE